MNHPNANVHEMLSDSHRRAAVSKINFHYFVNKNIYYNINFVPDYQLEV